MTLQTESNNSNNINIQIKTQTSSDNNSDNNTDTQDTPDTQTLDTQTTDNLDDVCINFIPEEFFTKPKRLCYYKMINKYFRRCDKEMVELMVRIINLQETDISLRVLEWVATKFTPKNLDMNIQDRELFNINIMYKAQLKSYKKKNFDPFRRDKKFLYNYDKTDPSKTVITTLGQLNFFKWAISSNIIKYVKDNFEYINYCMIKYNKDDKNKNKTKDEIKKKLEIKTTKIKTKLSDKKTSDKDNKEKFMLSFD